MATSSVKGHQRKTKSGKIVRVDSHHRATQGLAKKSLRQLKSQVKKMFYDNVSSTSMAVELANRYAERPVTAKLMTKGKWKDIKVTRHRTDSKTGERKPYTTTRRTASLTAKEWEHFFKENNGMIYSLIKRHFNFKSDLRDDLAAAGQRALFEAVGAYEGKFNPKAPADWAQHAFSYVKGNMQNEMNRLMASHFAMPYQKQRMFGKFKELWYRHHGDWTAIYKDMDLKKKDVYPSIDEKHANDPLPKEGYLTVVKEGSLAKKTEEHERRVNGIQDRFQSSMDSLEMRRGEEGSLSEYKASIAEYESQIKAMNNRLKAAKSKADKSEMFDKVKDLEQSKDLYEKTFKPINSDEDYDREKRIIENIRQAELREAKAKFDKEVDRTTLTGANELFRQFEALMDFKEVNLSGGVVGNEGQYTSTEEITMPEETEGLNSLGGMIIKESFKTTVEKFLNDINQLDERTASVLKMRLGLHESNELYAHGLWGKPMTVPEIADSVDRGLYARQDTQRGTHSSRVKAWKERKPSTSEKVKVSDSKYSKDLKAYNARKSKVKSGLKRMQSTAKWKSYDQKTRTKLRDAYRKTNKARPEDAPKKFTEKKVGKTEMNRRLRAWKLSKPIKEHATEVLVKRIRRDVDLGTQALRRLADPKNVAKMMHSYRAMRSSSMERPDIKRSLMKSLIFDNTLGFFYVSPDKLDLVKAQQAKELVQEEGLGIFDLIKGTAEKAIRNIFN
jgi:hypothetical protein